MKTLLLFIVLTTQTGCVELLNPVNPWSVMINVVMLPQTIEDIKTLIAGDENENEKDTTTLEQTADDVRL